jgi:hypothetical protein
VIEDAREGDRVGNSVNLRRQRSGVRDNIVYRTCERLGFHDWNQFNSHTVLRLP